MNSVEPRVIDVTRQREDGRRLLAETGACGSCGARGSPAAKLKLCSACETVAYCNAACQQQEWKEHKSMCKAMREVASVAAPPAVVSFTNRNVARAPLLPPGPPQPAARCDACGAVEREGVVALASCACNTAVYW
jgi:hypothetical protein